MAKLDITELDIKRHIRNMSSVSDGEIKDEIRRTGISISGKKFDQALSAYGITNFLTSEKYSSEISKLYPGPNFDIVLFYAVFMVRAYIAFIYMRSEHLERGLDHISKESALNPFKEFLRAGSQERGEDTIAQHIRNSLSHGTFSLSDDLKTVRFEDKNPRTKKIWNAEISTMDLLYGLCEQIFRFYLLAFEVSRGIVT